MNNKESPLAVTSFKDFNLTDADREWDGDAADKRVRKWADAEDEPNEKYRDTHVWYDADSKGNFTAYKLLICDVVNGKPSPRPCDHGCGRDHAGCSRRHRHSGFGRGPGKESPSEVLPQDGSHASLGGLIRLVLVQRPGTTITLAKPVERATSTPYPARPDPAGAPLLSSSRIAL